MAKKLTRRELAILRSREVFTGREQELNNFRRNLDLPVEDRKLAWMVFGEGGIGKTTLIKRFRTIILEYRYASTWIDSNTQPTVIDVMNDIAKQLEDQGHELRTFRKQYDALLKYSYDVETNQLGDPESVARVIGRLGRAVIEEFPGGGLVTSLPGEEKVEEKVGRFSEVVIRKIVKDKSDDIALLINPVDVLSRDFVGDISSIAEKQSTAIFIDDYEKTSHYLDRWIVSILEGEFGDLALEIMLLIAGRNRLGEDWNSEFILPFLETIHLERFSIEEAGKYLSGRGITDKSVIDVILELSERVPLLMATLASNIPDNMDQIGDPTGTAIERFLRWVPDSGQRKAIITCAVPRLLDLDLVVLLIGEKDAEKSFDYIKGMSFTSKRIDAGWKYHDVIRAFMLRHLREDSTQRWLNLQRLLIDYFLKQRNDLDLDLRKGFRNKAWQSYDLEWIYHSVCAFGRSAAKVWVERLLDCNVLTSPNEFDIRIGEAVEQAGEVLDDEYIMVWGRRIQEGIRAGYVSNEYSRAMPLIESVVGIACTISSRRHAQAISWRGWIHYKLGEYEAALQNYAHAIEIHPDNWKSYYRRGLLLRGRGDPEKALREYANAIEMQPLDGANYAGRGWTYYLMGDYKAASRDYARAIELQPEIDYRYRERGEICVRLGKDYKAALQDFSYAIQLNPAGTNYSWRGWTYYQMGDYRAALRDYARAIELQPDRASFYSERAIIHRELGHDLNAALQDYNRAIELEPQNRDYLHEIEQLYQEINSQKP